MQIWKKKKNFKSWILWRCTCWNSNAKPLSFLFFPPRLGRKGKADDISRDLVSHFLSLVNLECDRITLQFILLLYFVFALNSPRETPIFVDQERLIMSCLGRSCTGLSLTKQKGEAVRGDPIECRHSPSVDDDVWLHLLLFYTWLIRSEPGKEEKANTGRGRSWTGKNCIEKGKLESRPVLPSQTTYI